MVNNKIAIITITVNNKIAIKTKITSQPQTLPSIGQVLGEYINIWIENGVECKLGSNGQKYMKKNGEWVPRVTNPNYRGPVKVIMLISFILLIFVVLPLTINVIECFPLDKNFIVFCLIWICKENPLQKTHYKSNTICVSNIICPCPGCGSFKPRQFISSSLIDDLPHIIFSSSE